VRGNVRVGFSCSKTVAETGQTPHVYFFLSGQHFTDHPPLNPMHASIIIRRSKRVFLLGPSHHVYGRRCWLSPTLEYETPLGERRRAAWV